MGEYAPEEVVAELRQSEAAAVVVRGKEVAARLGHQVEDKPHRDERIAHQPHARVDDAPVAFSPEDGADLEAGDEVRVLLNQYQDQMRQSGASYQEMFKLIKNKLVRERKLVL